MKRWQVVISSNVCPYKTEFGNCKLRLADRALVPRCNAGNCKLKVKSQKRGVK
jgi:hypothetical protein